MIVVIVLVVCVCYLLLALYTNLVPAGGYLRKLLRSPTRFTQAGAYGGIMCIPGKISIASATYTDPNCANTDPTSYIAKTCDGNSSCNFNTTSGDLPPGCSENGKTMNIDYYCLYA